jgi:hypothetical protein
VRGYMNNLLRWGWAFIGSFLVTLFSAQTSCSQAELSNAKPVPRMQIARLPEDRLSIQRDGRELAEYHFGASLNRPFLFPIMGPSGRSLTRLGNIRDPQGHRHHKSIWVSHADVNGVDFWVDDGPGRIVCRRAVSLTNGNDSAQIQMENDWIDGTGEVLLRECRKMKFVLLPHDEWLLRLELQLVAMQKSVKLGKTPYGIVGVRVATSLSVQDGGGVIRNSPGSVNEKQVMGQQARWVDYSGPVTTDVIEGITMMDHPKNVRHPVHFHVRDDGCMFAALTYESPLTIEPAQPLVLCYGFYIHNGSPTPAQLDSRWQEFGKTQ